MLDKIFDLIFRTDLNVNERRTQIKTIGGSTSTNYDYVISQKLSDVFIQFFKKVYRRFPQITSIDWESYMHSDMSRMGVIPLRRNTIIFNKELKIATNRYTSFWGDESQNDYPLFDYIDINLEKFLLKEKLAEHQIYFELNDQLIEDQNELITLLKERDLLDFLDGFFLFMALEPYPLNQDVGLFDFEIMGVKITLEGGRLKIEEEEQVSTGWSGPNPIEYEKKDPPLSLDVSLSE